MPIINSAFLPPCPLLLPDIGKENSKILNKTTLAYQELAELLRSAEIETLIIISKQNPYSSKRIALNVASTLSLDFSDFGHIAEKRSYNPALGVADSIYQAIGAERAVRLISVENLDAGSGIPLYMLGEEMKKLKILVIYTSNILNKAAHYKAGQKIREALQDRPEKISIIASGSLSSRLKKNSLNGYLPKASRFDNKLIEYLTKADDAYKKVLKIEESQEIELQDRSLKQISLQLGIIGNTYQTKILAYQNDFGIGYLSMFFDLQVAQI